MKKVSGIEWLVRITIVVLLFLMIFLFIKIAPIWQPILHVAVTILIPFFVAALFTYLLHPLVEMLYRHHIPRPLAILLIYVLFFGGLGYGAFKGIPYLITQLRELREQIPTFIEYYHQGINAFYYQTSDLPEKVHDHFRGLLHEGETYLNQTLQKIIDLLKGLVRSIVLILMIPVLVFYFLNDFSLIQRATAFVVPNKWHDPGKKMLQDVDESLGHYIRGQFLVCLFLAAMASVVFWIMKLPYFVLLGMIIGITDVIPYFGPIIGAIPALLMAATISWKMVIFVAVFILILQFIEGNLLSPFIVGKSLHMHPIFIIFAIFLGGEVAGLLGLLLAVPFFAVARVVYIHVRSYLRKDEVLHK